MLAINTFQAFADRWIATEDRVPLPLSRLAQLEDALGVTLPATYKSFLMTVGPVLVPIALLDSIVDQRLDVTDVQEFYGVETAVSVTRDWRRNGLPDEFYAIACDCMGNQYCLPIQDPGEEMVDNPNVWFFDHEEGEAYDLDVQFSDWIQRYADIESTER